MLHRPAITPDIICRTRITKLLDDNAYKPFVLICAPPGYGKSMAVSHWLERQSKKYVWFSLQESLNEVTSFVKAFKVALDQLDIKISSEDRNQIFLNPEISEHELSESLFKKIDNIQNQSILVLDDYHFISDNKVNALMDTLLDYMPKNLQLILITHRDPSLKLQKSRLYGKLLDIRMRDLALDFDEFQSLLASTGQNDLNRENMEKLLKWTEGWILGVKIAISLKSLTGNQLPFDNSVALAKDIDFFVNQLTASLDDDFSQMIKTVALCDRFNEELVNTLLDWRGITTIDGHSFLQHLRDKNLFIIDLDDQGKWYRFHHLFRDLVVKQFLRDDHECANEALKIVTGWFTRHGMIDEGIRIAVRTGDLELATLLIIKYRFQIFNKDEWWVVQSWLDLIPVGIRNSNVELLLSQLWIFENTVQLRDISTTLDILSGLLQDESNQAVISEFHFHQGWMKLWIQNNAKEALLHLEQSKQSFEGNTMFVARRELYIAIAKQMLGECDTALKSLDEIEKKSLPTDLMYLRMNMAKMFVLLPSARFPISQKVSEKFLFLSKNSHFESIKAFSWYIRGNTAFQTFEENVASQALSMATTFQGVLNFRVHFDAYAGFCIWHSLHGNLEVIQESMQTLEAFTLKLQEVRYLEYIHSIKYRILWHRGKVEDSLLWVLKDWKQPVPTEYLFAIDVPAFTKIRIILTHGTQQQVDESLQYLRDIETDLQHIHNHYHDVDILIMKAIGAFRKGDIENANEFILKAAKLAESQGIIRPFIELIVVMPELLETVGMPNFSAHSKRVIAPFLKGRFQNEILKDRHEQPEAILTLRESEIVTMATRGLRNKEIADQLHISEVTVKSHLTNIFRKLEVSNRTSMVQKYRELGITP